MSGFWLKSRDEAVYLQPSHFRFKKEITTRWRDNDIYGHVNNAVYYEFFDTAINSWLLERLPSASAAARRMVVAESSCRYLSEIAFPQPLIVTLNVERIGVSSVTYELGIFPGSEDRLGEPIVALGRWVHVFVDPKTTKPGPIPTELRTVLEEGQRS